MKKNRTALIITIILIIIAGILVVSNRNSSLRKEVSQFALQDTSSVTKVFLVDKNNNRVLLERGEQGWTLNKKHHAHPFHTRDLLKTMSDLEVRSPVPKAARNNVLSRLASTGVKVEVYQEVPRIDFFGLFELFPREKRTKVYYVGGPTQDNLGTYMLMEGEDEPMIVFIPSFRGFVSARYSTKADDWRDHTVFNTPLEDIRSISIAFKENPRESYTVVNAGNEEFRLLAGLDRQEQPYDTLRMLNFITSFSKLNYEAILNNSLPREYIDSVTSLPPAHIITLVDKTGDTTEMVTFRKKGFSELYDEEKGIQLVPFDLDRLYALINGRQDFVLIQYFVFDDVLRTASYLKGLEEERPHAIFDEK
ncbi:MAG: DUF4340 domain-containing protein [Bacteroidales bacterium]